MGLAWALHYPRAPKKRRDLCHCPHLTSRIFAGLPTSAWTTSHSWGGKNASRGELYRALAPMGVRVPPWLCHYGWRLPALSARGTPEPADPHPAADLNTHDLANLRQRGRQVRHAMLAAPGPRRWPTPLWRHMSASALTAVRRPWMSRCAAGATAEDLPDASFAGQQETYLNVQGHAALLDTCKRCFWAGLFFPLCVIPRGIAL